MKFSSGSMLGPYEIIAPLGAGAMGEVYQARDTRLKRQVAVKVLPSEFSTDKERLQRFEKEAHSASALNHPNIVTIHEIGQIDSSPYIVMELVDGKTLREILSSGPLPLRKMLNIATQIAEGLAKAHSAGIVHRDLKPENLMITKEGLIKILDFGLAKLTLIESSADRKSQTPTIGETHPGLILGTVMYMSPEQACGLPVDFRSDQFSFGIILYEMLTGKQPFQRNSIAETISAVLNEEPGMNDSVHLNIPEPLRWILESCMVKDSEGRYASTKDLARDLARIRDRLSANVTSAEALFQSAPHKNKLKHLIAAISGLAILATVIILITTSSTKRPEPGPTIRFAVHSPEKSTFNFIGRDAGPVAISPDGRRLAFSTTTQEGRRLLFVHSLDKLVAQSLNGTDGASYPFWSYDSRSIGFFADGKLKKIESTGGAVQTLTDAPLGRGGTWNKDGVIVFSPGVFHPLYRISSAGGATTPVTKIAKGELSHRWPHFLPDGQHFVYLEFKPSREGVIMVHDVRVGSLDNMDSQFLLKSNSRVAYASPGYLLSIRESTLMAIPFDAKSLRITGEPLPIADNAQVYLNTASAIFSASENGNLAYQAGGTPTVSQLIWFDRSGKQVNAIGPPSDYEDPHISPDGSKVALNKLDPQTGVSNIWIYDLSSGTDTRFTFSRSFDHNPIWSPDKSKIVFDSNRKGPAGLYQRSLIGTEGEELLFDSDEEKTPTDWSPDGQIIIYQSSNLKNRWDLWTLPLSGDRKPRPLLRNEYNEMDGRISPNGKWLAYTSDESGLREVYVSAISGSSGKWQISTAGGSQPKWRRDGKEIYYLAADRKLMAVPIQDSDHFQAGTANPLFETRSRYTGNSAYDVTSDGQRFLINTVVSGQTSTPITVVINWTSDLKK